MVSPGRDEPGQTPTEKEQRTSILKILIDLAAASILLGTFATIGGFAFTIYTTFRSATPVYALNIVQGDKDLLRTEKVVLALTVDNKTTGEAMDLKSFTCSLKGNRNDAPRGVPRGVSAEPSSDARCSFDIRNIAIADKVIEWPLTVVFSVDVSKEPYASQRERPTVTVLFHDIERPVIEPSSFVFNGGRLTVTPIIRTNRENAAVDLCEWRPATVFEDAIIHGTSCTAVISKSALSGPLPTISVVVEFQVPNQPPFEVQSHESPIVLPAGLPSGSSVRADTSPTQSGPLASPPAPSGTQPPVPILQPKARSASLPSATPPPATAANDTRATTVSALIASLSGLREAPRYDRLEQGLQPMGKKEPITPNEALDLLGPLFGTLRRSALGLILPHLTTPITSDQALSLMDGFPSADRADVLHALQGCIAPPVDKDRLLVKIVGADRQWVEPTLTSTGPCLVSQTGQG